MVMTSGQGSDRYQEKPVDNCRIALDSWSSRLGAVDN